MYMFIEQCACTTRYMTTNKELWALNEDSDQHAQPRSLTKDFAVRKYKACFLAIPN